MPEVILRDGCERKLGHGVITTALIDALYHCNSDGDGLIEVATLPARVHGHVCKLADGGEVRAAIAKRCVGYGDRPEVISLSLSACDRPALGGRT